MKWYARSIPCYHANRGGWVAPHVFITVYIGQVNRYVRCATLYPPHQHTFYLSWYRCYVIFWLTFKLTHGKENYLQLYEILISNILCQEINSKLWPIFNERELLYTRNMSTDFPLSYLMCNKNIPRSFEEPKYAELLYHMNCKKWNSRLCRCGKCMKIELFRTTAVRTSNHLKTRLNHMNKTISIHWNKITQIPCVNCNKQ